MRKRPSMVDMPPPATEESAALRIVIAADGSGWPASERMTPPILPGPLPGPGVWALNCAATAHIEMKTNRIRRKGAFRETRNDAMKFNSSQGLRWPQTPKGFMALHFQLRRRKQTCNFYFFTFDPFAAALFAVHNGQHTENLTTRFANGAQRAQRRLARGNHILDDNDAHSLFKNAFN